MNEHRFESSVARLRRRPLPEVPGDLEERVLRRIRLVGREESGFWAWLGTSLPRPALAAPALALVVAVSALTVLVSAPPAAADPGRDHLATARLALGFEVFAPPAADPLHRD